MTAYATLFLVLLCASLVVEASKYADQLYEDLLYYYNKNVRPVKNASEAVQVKFGASLIRIIDVVSGFEAFQMVIGI
ncbi:hypothetical protein L596_029741 [Steinernema carpocapsae]|uniref:Neurotransmitter-gated ion-channel ligand-binding domain-containing protein n=1 Tax=Steinernema carpocapsae TaxID=34508 RepID=A0A4U5LQP4_STECR|nr:hypothetical protein L596_029741 [Steinernema carpocapsae]